jgi:hypothetical protein
MKFTTHSEVNDFIRTVEECDGHVWLESKDGDRFNLKSLFSRYIAIGALLDNHGDELELFCQLPEDEQLFYKYFNEHPGVN